MDSFLSLFGPSQTSDECDDTSSSDSEILDSFHNLPPEPQAGNIEYKLKLIDPPKQRFDHLVTQMKWRLNEGCGEAIYEIGVGDSGMLFGLNEDDMKASLDTLKLMAQTLNASYKILRRKYVDEQKSVVEVQIRKLGYSDHNEVRVAVLGCTNAGKSTTLGVLTQGEFDNGRGKARLNLLRHMHEIISGTTSSISHELLGFDCAGNVINYKFNEMMTSEEICDKSSKLISFIDLAGSKKYLKTTILGISGYSPHYAMLVVSASADVSQTNEFLVLLKAFNIPFYVIITKIDVLPFDQTIHDLENSLMEVDNTKTPMLINSEEDIASIIDTDNVVPIFLVSNVTKQGLFLVERFLWMLTPKINQSESEKLEKEPLEFHIDEIFRVFEVGTIVGGLLVKGTLKENIKLKIGPMQDGSFVSVGMLKTIHRNKSRSKQVKAGSSASLSLSLIDQLPCVRIGMVLVEDNSIEDDDLCGTSFFQATIVILYHATAISRGFQCTAFIGSVRQSCIIEGIMGNDSLVTGQNASVLCRFLRNPEYLKPDMQILLREGQMKAIGKITQIFPINDKKVN